MLLLTKKCNQFVCWNRSVFKWYSVFKVHGWYYGYFKVTYILLPNKRTCFNITMLHINHDNTDKFYHLNVSIGPGTYMLKGICNYHKFRNILRYVMKVNMNFQYMLSNIKIHNMQTFEKQPSIYSRNCFLHFLSIIWP